MHSVQRSRIVPAPTADVWPLLDDFGGVSRYHPNVDSSRVVNGVESGLGACRECVFEDGGRIEETIIGYEPGESYTVAFTDMGPYPLVSNVVRIDVESMDEGHSRVTFTAQFEPKYGPLGWLMGRVVMEPRFAKQLDTALEGLAAHVRPDDAYAGTVAST
jgi:carbon monoxide dehydrogenase subunit G